eukprot:TRINITY_DN80068_c0_g1_i1.p1 TRINITY_DN80068_c0_g1~~TRINITY_DN80068_c0_g1_i1.p1  ORF type:complete len:483 (-),score=69.99 TRINITY_DN80068_c0_g1_i1:2-1426(-)
MDTVPNTPTEFAYNVIAESHFIPMRLSSIERRQVDLLVAALNVSEYTDKVDGLRFTHQRGEIICRELKDIYQVLIGLQIASDHDVGMKLVNKPLREQGEYFATLFEIGRRYKIMNPDKMRTEYGKLIYLLQDACSPETARRLGFAPLKPIMTVEMALQECGCTAILQDPRLLEATSPIIDKTGAELEIAKRQKETLISTLCKEYSQDSPHSVLERCIRSIDDVHCQIALNACKLDRLILFLKSDFNPQTTSKACNLGITSGKNGARLSHSHTTQYNYVLQSLTLWKFVSLNMFKLWHAVEQDMLDSSRPYRFRGTGQGYNRVQSAPRVAAEMNSILRCTQKVVNSQWVGLSVVHLGDDQVPNALNFIDKYTQVARIVHPILQCVDNVERVGLEWPGIPQLIAHDFSDAQGLRLALLRDFFRHGFDGGGGNNPMDAGSCIDGRLTSAWNWCSRLSQKAYYPIFLLTGFTSFDGQF